MSNIDKIARDHLYEFVKLDPAAATYFGLEGATDKFGDYSPKGAQAFHDLNRTSLGQLASAEITSNADRIAKDAMYERLSLEIDKHDAGEYKRNLNVISSPIQTIRRVFDLMPRASDDDYADISARLSKVPLAITQYKECLDLGLNDNQAAASRQALECAKQARAYGDKSNGFFIGVSNAYQGKNQTLKDELIKNAVVAANEYNCLAEYLENNYAGSTTASDDIGAERWKLMCRTFNGITLDPAETYAWGWEELHSIEASMEQTAQKILPRATIEEVISHLETDPKYIIHGQDNFIRWNQELHNNTIAALDGRHFNIPDPVKVVEAMIAPPGGAAAMYYTPPSSDFVRPGRTWYPTLGRTTFPLWTEVSTAYHEGVPGHHLQFGYITYLGEKLNAFSRTLGTVSGYLEGWALYAERLMDELGYLEDPVYKLGMLSAQALRAARVVVDIGLHHQYKIPKGHKFLPPEVWNPSLAVELIHSVSGRERNFSISEVDRYLGWPAQATSYKVGERVWLETRQAAKKAQGSNFSLSDFHQRGFELGFVGLEQLRKELSS